MRLVAGALLAGLALCATAASARDHNGYAAIQQGNYVKAEQTLLAQRQAHPEYPELMLNLAAFYTLDGRIAEARALYRDALAQPNVLMDVTLNTSDWSHALANEGQRPLAPAYLSSR